MGAGPDGACMHVLMCGFTYMYVFSRTGVGSSVYEYMWGQRSVSVTVPQALPT